MEKGSHCNGILTAMEASNFECVMAKLKMKSDYLTFLSYYPKIFISNPIQMLLDLPEQNWLQPGQTIRQLYTVTEVD